MPQIGCLSSSSPALPWATCLISKGYVLTLYLVLYVLSHFCQTVDWVPIDVAGRSVVDIVTSTQALPSVVNLVHSRPVPWSYVFAAINKAVDGRLQVVPFSEWLNRVDALSTNATEHDFENVVSTKPFHSPLCILRANERHFSPQSSSSDSSAPWKLRAPLPRTLPSQAAERTTTTRRPKVFVQR